MTRRQAFLTLGASISGIGTSAAKRSPEPVRLQRVPEGGLQPQVVIDARGIMHLVYFTGDPRQGNLFYVTSNENATDFSRAIPVNSGPGSAIATGTIRGAQIALGRNGRLHVAWNGSGSDGPLNPDSGTRGMPMLYTRLNAARNAFEPQRNLMNDSFGLDGGGSLAADDAGNVYVAWHGIGESEASGTGKQGEARRRVWMAESRDDGRSFSKERMAWAEETGACGCCGMKFYVDGRSNIFALYRAATQSVHRDIYLLRSSDHGGHFKGNLLHKWEINACPMSSMDLAGNGTVVAAAWETAGQVYWARVDGADSAIQPISAPGEGKGRKHPHLAVNRKGEVLLVWTEGTGWQRGGSLAWQLYDETGKPAAEKGQFPSVAAWSFAAAVARSDNSFVILV